MTFQHTAYRYRNYTGLLRYNNSHCIGQNITCFMVVSRVSEVRGRGFSLSKKYE